jgi:hypothetical protein
MCGRVLALFHSHWSLLKIHGGPFWKSCAVLNSLAGATCFTLPLGAAANLRFVSPTRISVLTANKGEYEAVILDLLGVD